MASNRDGIFDDFFERDDWVELYNSGGILNLEGYYLSDDPDLLTKWQFPSTNAGLTTILPNNHLLIWTDNDPEQGENHASFKTSGDGETLYLVDPDGVTIIDEITYPAQAADVSYGRSCDACADWVFFNNSTPDETNMEITPEPALLFINEVQVRNNNYIQDPLGDYDAWIEIYNPNASPVNLSGYSIEKTSDGSSTTILGTNPVLTVVPAEGFVLLWADSEVGEGENHLSYELDFEDELVLRDVNSEVVDSYTYNDTPENYSWGRSSDAGLTSMEFNIPTPRVTNSLIIVQPEELYLNELMADNESDTSDVNMQFEDWFEVYNPGNSDVNMAGYYFSDNPENPVKWQIPTDDPANTTIPAGGYKLFWADEDGSQGWNHVSFKLSDQGEQLSMYSPDGFTLVDRITYGVLPNNISFGRLIDGDTPWVNFIETTPEYSNNGATLDIKKELGRELKVYPNPVQRGADVKLSESADVVVFTMSGQAVLGLNNTKSIPTSQLSAG
ncbi:MAG: lamin tail domain-containing protein, partial [Flavobacteriales bacterium]